MVNNFIISLVSFMIFIYICQLFFEFQEDFANLIAVCFLAMLANASLKFYTDFHLRLISTFVIFSILIYACFKGAVFYKAIVIYIY